MTSTSHKATSIQNKILAGYGAVILLVVGLAILVSRIAGTVEKLDEQVVVDAVPYTIKISELQKSGLALVQADAELSSMAIALKTGAAGIETRLSTVLDRLEQSRAALIAAASEYESLPRSEHAEANKFIEELTAIAKDMATDSAEYEKLMLHPDTSVSEILTRVEHSSEDSALFAELITAAMQQEQTELAEAAEGLGKGLSTARWSIWSSVSVVILASVLAALVISRGIARPIRALRAAALRVGEGDLTVAIGKNSADEVGDLAVAFNQMIINLRDAKEKLMRSERLSVLGQVAGTVSHELRNPLASIQSSIDLMRAVADDKSLDFKRHLDRVDRNIERCDRIIGDLLEFTRIKELQKQRIAIDPWISELLDEHKLPDGIELRREFMAKDIFADIDPIRFRQVLVNLVDNAAQALTEKGWSPSDSTGRVMTVRTEANNRQLKISIADNGPGIKQDNFDKIFEPLFTTKSFGVGLGLPTVRQLVDQHDGKVEVESGDGLGTRFVICLPLAGARVDAGDAPVKAA